MTATGTPPRTALATRAGTYVLRRLGLAGFLALAAAVATADFALAIRPWASIALSAAQTLLVIPWFHIVLRLDFGELRLRPTELGRRVRMLAIHTATFTLMAIALVSKWLVLEKAARGDLGEFVPSYRIYGVASLVVFLAGLLGRGSRFGRFLASVADQPARLMALSFGVTGLLGGFLLTLPVSLRRIGEASFTDGLFTSVSAVCVTGLVVNDVGTTYTPFGQAVILALIQAGGVGIMVLSAFLAVAAGRRLRVRSSAVLAEMMDTESLANLRRTVKGIVLTTLAVEAVGAAVLWAAFGDRGAEGPGGPVWVAAFHSVSAFCNAGFSLFPGNLGEFAGSWAVCGSVMALVVTGGLGYPVLSELAQRLRRRLRGERPPRPTLHLRVVLATSAALTAGLVAVFLTLEWDGVLAGRPFHERALASLFQAVTPRTAGFNTLDFGAMRAPVLMLVALAMFVGASPGSTGGGIKTTTFAVLLAAFRAELRGWPGPRMLDRAFSPATVRRALGVAVVSVLVVAAACFALLLAERHEPARLVFEAVSAFATCGLSTGITPELSVAGKLIVIATMFTGRIGPLTLAVALATRVRPSPFLLPQERVMIG